MTEAERSRLMGRFVVDGIDLYESFGMFMSNEYTLSTPQPQTSLVDIPGRDGSLDLTDALTGHAAYDDRNDTFIFYLIDDDATRENVQNILIKLHGQQYDYTLGLDPGFTYTGRFAVTDIDWDYAAGVIQLTIQVTARPYKLKQLHTQTFNAVGGSSITCFSGMRPVHPVVTADSAITVTYNGVSTAIPAGNAYRLTGVTFHYGNNDIWISIANYVNARWSDIADRTWESLSTTPWAHVVVDDQSPTSDYVGNANVTVQWREEYL